MSKSHRAFTLIEMSVVIAIIGLVVGGIMVARSMIRNSELQSLMIDVERYKQAVVNFQTQYKELPGDFIGTGSTSAGSASPEGLWGSDASCPSTTTNAIAKKETCNGDGNGKILTYETFRFWQQLANAMIIEEQFSGVKGPTGNATDAVPGINIPKLKMKGGGIAASYLGTLVGDSVYLDGQYGHVFMVGALNTGTAAYGKLLTAEEAKNIDMKMDDGMPFSGTVYGYKYQAGGSPPVYGRCVTNNSSPEYALTLKGPQCQLIFITGF